MYAQKDYNEIQGINTIVSRQVMRAGDRFGKLIAVAFHHSSANRSSYWLYSCDCGGEVIARNTHVRKGDVSSCGCIRRERFMKHDMSQTSLFVAWVNMRNRCYKEDNDMFALYGGRGITVCARWLESFQNFYDDMGDKPTDKHSLDRIDSNGNYEPNNCRWSTNHVQTRNRRSNRFYEFKGERLCLSDLAEKYGFKYACINKRLMLGWTIEKALTIPSRRTV